MKKNSKSGPINGESNSKLKKRNKKSGNLSEKDEIEEIKQRCENFDDAPETFSDFPLSSKTHKGLNKCGFTKPSEIQQASISIALKGKDVLGAAKTGSGKTMAFLIPILETLWKEQWTQLDGLGALIISPTRELAYQTFQVLKKLGRFHDFSAALVVGGNDWEFERQRISTANIVISTPGRLLQHMDENSTFSCDNLKILVLDEADRILDMGFQRQLNAVIENLPPERQTLLFSATQTKSVKDLARLSLNEPMYVSVHENSKFSTPETLIQSCIECEHEKKIDLLYSFLRNHLHKKILIFLTTCKQVRFFNELFKKIRPGMSILALYGSMNPVKRTKVYEQFCSKDSVALLATDIAARGLDFPAVDWVVQLDCPSDAQEYIHRSGRTARYQSKGESLLVLSSSEKEGMLSLLKENKVPIQEIEVDQKKMQTISGTVDSLCAQSPQLKDFAQKCFVSVVRAIHLMKHKKIFTVDSIDFDALARSYGLAITPRLRFLKKQQKKGDKSNGLFQDEDEDIGEDILAVKKSDVFKATEAREENDVEEDLLNRVSKKQKKLSKVAAAKKLMKINSQLNKKIVFNEDEDEEKWADLAGGGLNLDEAKKEMEERDVEDRQLFKERLREKRREKKRKIKESEDSQKRKKKQKKDQPVAMLPSGDEDSGSELDTSWLPDPDKPRESSEEEEIDPETLADHALRLLDS